MTNHIPGNKIPNWMRIALALGAVALVAAIVLPVWRIELAAPQYPEGLILKIFASKLGGDVAIVNGLNHYIGMKPLKVDDFPEFIILPYILGFFAAFTLLVALIGKRKLLYTLTGMYIAFAIVAMADFWKWEYNYGHNLNTDAPIQVPGMSYQPPLFGYKQLLNFGAFSVPDIGGWLMAAAGLIMVVCIFFLLRKRRALVSSLTSVVALAMFSSCNSGPEPLKLNRDQCDYCKMTIADARFGAEILTKKGKVWKFDDTHCLAGFLDENRVPREQIKNIYIVRFDGSHELLNVHAAFLLKAENLKSPMNGNVAAFADEKSRNEAAEKLGGLSILPGELGL
ncbi:MAG: nitrous oxide reductase accessory protein NosL [Chitinophagaceae bacterium]